MSFVLLGTLAINCAGDCYAGALLAAPFLYNAYGQNLYIREFNWWFRLFTFILIFGCNGTGLYGILKFKTSICKITSYISVTVWFFVLVLMLLGSRNASIVAMRNSMGKAALEGKSLTCSVLLTQSESNETSWSGICYILGLCLLLNFQAAAAYFMQTLVIVPVNTEALDKSQDISTDMSDQNLPALKQPAIKLQLDGEKDSPSPTKESEMSYLSHQPRSAKVVPKVPPRVRLEDVKSSSKLNLKPLEDPPEDRRPAFGRPVNVNSITVRKFQDRRTRK